MKGVKTKRTKHLISLFVIMLLLASVFAACSKKGAEGDPSDQGSVAPKEIKFLLSHKLTKYAMQYDGDDIYTKELSKLSGYNLHYEFLGHQDDFIQQLTVRFASKDLADVVETDDAINSSIHPGAVEQGIFHELNDLLDKYGPNIKAKIGQAQWDSPRVSKDGKIYAIPIMIPSPAKRVVFIRQDWLDKLKMQTPKTVDDYLAYFEAVKTNDMNGNGDPNDEFGFFVRENLSYSDLFFVEFGAHPAEWMYRDGKLQPGLIQPEIKESLKFWKMLYDKGYVNPNMFTNKSSDWRAGIKQGIAGIWTHDVTNYAADWDPSTFVNEKDVKLTMLPGPEGPAGQGLTLESDQIRNVWVIPTTNKHPEEVIKFIDWAWSSPEADQFFAYGVLDHNYTVTDGKVNYDANNPANSENNANEFFRQLINPRGDGRLSPLVLSVDPNADLLMSGLEAANASIYENDGLYMPNLEALKTRPELLSGASTLFLDMFAKVVTGKTELDSGFDNFVTEWKRRGGDEAIQQATDWYKKFHNIQ